MMRRNLIIAGIFLCLLAAWLRASENIKAIGAVAKANVKAVGAVAEANIKAFGAVDNTAAGGAITEVGSGSQRALSNTTTGGQDSKALSFPGNVTAGNLIVVGGSIWTSGGTTVAPAVTDSQTNTYTVVFPGASPGGVSWRTFLAYAVVGGSGACTVTVNPNGSASDFCFGIDEFSGVSVVDVNGDHSTHDGSAGPAQDTITTVAAATLIIAVISNESAVTTTPLTDYTQIAESESGSNNQPINFQFRIVSSAATYTPGCTLGGSTAWQCQTYSFKP